MNFVKHRPTGPELLLGVLLATVAVDRPCSAQSSGYMPMEPVTSTSSTTGQRTVVPGPPMRPQATSRPSGWAGEPEASPWIPPAERSGVPATPTGKMNSCKGIRIIARVGSEAILESEAAAVVNEIIEANKDRIPADQLEAQREILIEKRLQGLIRTKLIVLDAKRTIPAEGWSRVEEQLSKQYEEVELEKMMKNAEVDTRHAFDQKLRSYGTSLAREKQAFIERTLAQQWVREQIKHDDEVTYDQMVRYYRDHQEEFTTPARTQWEELVVEYSKHPTKAAAYNTIARMGTQVFGGAPLADVARARSDGVTASDGGRRDWTSKGALVCEKLDQALFSLPVGQLSPIIEGPTGFHIVRITRREDVTVRPFLEAQVDIKQKIKQERSEQKLRDYLAKLETRTPVWTIYDRGAEKTQTATPRTPLRR